MSNINITNTVHVTEAVAAQRNNASSLVGCAGLLLAAGVTAGGLYLLAAPALELAVDVAASIGSGIGAVVTGALDLMRSAGHLASVLAMPTLWTIGYGCVALVGLALASAAWSARQERDEQPRPAVRLVDQPQQHALIIVADQAQAEQAIKMLPASASYEVIELPVQKETVLR